MSDTQEPAPENPEDGWKSPPKVTGDEPDPATVPDKPKPEENPLANTNVVGNTIPPNADPRRKPE